MSQRQDDQVAFYAVPDAETAKAYAITCASGTVAYLDLSPGQYECWAPQGSATEHFRWVYLDMPDPTSPPTAVTGDIAAPTAGTSAQTAGPAQAMAPGSAQLRFLVVPNKRIAILYSSATAVTLYCTRVL